MSKPLYCRNILQSCGVTFALTQNKGGTRHHSFLVIPRYGHPLDKDTSFSLNSTRLIRTLSMASSVSVLTRFDYGGPQLSRQNQKAHGKNKILHGKTENLTAKTKYLTRQNRKPQKTKTSRQNQKPHGKNKKTSLQNQRPHGKTRYFTAKTKYLTAKPNTSQQKPNTSRQKQIPTAKPKQLCFCCEVFGFAVTVLGHRI